MPEAEMSGQVDREGRDWQGLRREIRILCYEASRALEEGRGLDDLRPRSIAEDIEAARPELFRVLENEWSGYRVARGEGNCRETSLYDLMNKLCRRGPKPGAAWNAVLELVRAGVAETRVQARESQGVTNLLDGEGSVYIRLSSEAINRFIDSMTPEENPKWDRGARTLIYKNTICKTFRRFADKQFEILDAFEKAGWPKSVTISGVMSRQTAESLNSTMETESPIRFGFSEKTRSVSWRLVEP